ncbi:hypothetical protein GUJ93_ZPchr0009g796 [Zizania palustris]|uniref:Uncharacterized protein n=1 Tax=Zizania palustris TaxID=103762 RepID=A0A8J5RLD7_ZIZPA|nr:hypothetical protein GUJ93_ZPchr0009g796 [Zizania palustris]
MPGWCSAAQLQGGGAGPGEGAGAEPSGGAGWGRAAASVEEAVDDGAAVGQHDEDRRGHWAAASVGAGAGRRRRSRLGGGAGRRSGGGLAERRREAGRGELWFLWIFKDRDPPKLKK